MMKIGVLLGFIELFSKNLGLKAEKLHRTQSILKYYNQKTKCKIPVFRTDMVAGVKQPVESAGFIFADS